MYNMKICNSCICVWIILIWWYIRCVGGLLIVHWTFSFYFRIQQLIGCLQFQISFRKFEKNSNFFQKLKNFQKIFSTRNFETSLCSCKKLFWFRIYKNLILLCSKPIRHIYLQFYSRLQAQRLYWFSNWPIREHYFRKWKPSLVPVAQMLAEMFLVDRRKYDVRFPMPSNLLLSEFNRTVTVMLVTKSWWRIVDVGDWLSIFVTEYWCPTQNRHQNLLAVTNTLRLQHRCNQIGLNSCTNFYFCHTNSKSLWHSCYV